MLKANIWSFLDTGAQDGAFNMALDEALSVVIPISRPVLRLYTWNPFAISLGYHQNYSGLNLLSCQKDGVDVVRRPTGGRAIYHAEELTYSIIIPRSHKLFRKPSREVYNLVSQALAKGLSGMADGVSLKQSQLEKFTGNSTEFACFATAAKYEVMHQSRKLVGSAQRRYRTAILQHGSIMIGNRHLEIAQYFHNQKTDEVKKKISLLRKKTVSLSDIADLKGGVQELAMLIRRAVEETFNITLQSNELAQAELETVRQLKPKFTLTEEEIK